MTQTENLWVATFHPNVQWWFKSRNFIQISVVNIVWRWFYRNNNCFWNGS